MPCSPVWASFMADIIKHHTCARSRDVMVTGILLWKHPGTPRVASASKGHQLISKHLRWLHRSHVLWADS